MAQWTLCKPAFHKLKRLPEFLAHVRVRLESALNRRLPPADFEPCRLHAAMRYVTLGGGKRLRAALVYATGEALGAQADALDVPACALELLHAYSLVHDDLPAMDNDDLRRGKPSCHKAFDEATAILAGDALQTLAFELLARGPGTAIDPTKAGHARPARTSSWQRWHGRRPGHRSRRRRPVADAGRTEDMHARKPGP